MLFPSAKMIGRGRGGGLDVDKVFATTLYTDPGLNQNTYQPLPFNPDLVWHKNRQASDNHRLLDTLRGSNSLSTNLTSAQSDIGPANGNPSESGFFRYFGPSNSGQQIASWSFRRAKKFFDIVTYIGNGVAGRQIPHGLGVMPGMIMVKRINGAGDWSVYHISRGAVRNLILSSNSAESSGAVGSAIWSGTEPTESEFRVGDSTQNNQNGIQYVAYLFAHDPSPSGIIQCGQYTGNGSTTGPVVTLGWEPQFLLIKAASQTGQWNIRDNKRDTINPRRSVINANTNEPEVVNAAYNLDFQTAGFQPKNVQSDFNTSGQTFIYLAIRKGKA